MFSDKEMEEFASDMYLSQILTTIASEPKTAKEISSECNIPINTVYRKLHTLEEKKFLKVSGMLSDNVKTRMFQTRMNAKQNHRNQHVKNT